MHFFTPRSYFAKDLLYPLPLSFVHHQCVSDVAAHHRDADFTLCGCKTTSGYEAMILTPEQAYAVFRNLRDPERTLTLLAAGTGLRISECLGLQWQDVSFADAMIHVRQIY